MKTYEPMAGEHIEKAANAAIALAKFSGERVQFMFNDQEIIVGPNYNASAVAAAFNAECERRHAEYVASPEGQKRKAEQDASQAIADASAAEGILPFEKSDPEGWDTCVAANDDGYGACAVRYAARWANLMEKRMSEGSTLPDCADKASHDADTEGVTGFMYGCAVGILAKTWKHGEDLRRWHNLKSQIGTEGEKANESGGVLNPALLNIG